MNLLLVGVNHKTASVGLREKLAGLIPDLDAAYQSLTTSPEIAEIILYSTCNRLELLCVAVNRPRP
jgi:glutamyl-tRNA reductase